MYNGKFSFSKKSVRKMAIVLLIFVTKINYFCYNCTRKKYIYIYEILYERGDYSDFYKNNIVRNKSVARTSIEVCIQERFICARI